MEIDSDTDRCHTILHKQNEIALSPGSGLRWLPPIEPRRWFNFFGYDSLKRTFPAFKCYSCIVRHIAVLFILKKEAMEAQVQKKERIELRVSAEDKKFFKRAQELSGDKSFSSFIVRTVKEKSEDIISRYDRIIATEKDRQVFFEAIFSDSTPNQNLIEAAKRYKSKSSK
jgi:uncharacterized protein (DUF1778 family)